jgi:hypothetical protein
MGLGGVDANLLGVLLVCQFCQFPRLVTFVGAFEHFMSITRSADRRLGGTKKHRAAVVKQAMAYESDDSDDDGSVLPSER